MLRATDRSPLGDSFTRRLAKTDEALLTELLHDDRGFGLFISSNMRSYGFQGQVSYWGQFTTAPASTPAPIVSANGATTMAPARTTLTGVLMLVGDTATLYAPTLTALAPLYAIALRQRLRFMMGQADMIAPLLSHPSVSEVRHEDHHFAELPAHRFQRQPVVAPVQVRRAQPGDTAGLAHLYWGATGFEDLTISQIQPIMQHRVTHLRTFIVERARTIIAAASTSAESTDAAMVGGVWTLPSDRGQGYATVVVAALCADLLREKRRPYLFYLTNNESAAHIYSKIGFRAIGAWKVVYFA